MSEHTETSVEPSSISPSQGKVSLRYLENGVAILWLGQTQEKVVTFTMERMRSLSQAISELKERKPKALVIAGPSLEMFTAGADINLIRGVSDPQEGERLAREGQEVFNSIAALPFPSIAAISGPCVGGGCEMVLACTYRLISDHKSSVIGLPEIKLGILPGFGGTQRLPRLIGLPKALDIILGGKTLRPSRALKYGMVDKVVPAQKLLEQAEKLALGDLHVKRKKLTLIDSFLTFTNWGRSIVKKKALVGIKKETKGFYPAPPAALEAVFCGLEEGLQTGLKFEAKELGRLIVTPESKSLVRIFFLTEASKTLGKSAKDDVKHLHALVVGGGIMGAGIAGVFAKNECPVIIKDTSEEVLLRAKQHIRSQLEKLSFLSESERSFILNRIETTTNDATNFGNANFLIEAIYEDLDTKKRVLSDLAKLLPEDAIVATNTSALSVTQIALAINSPERVIGMHFFNPVEKMPLVEVVRGKKTGPKAIAIVCALATKLGKFPIVVEDVPGFLVNRVLTPYLIEAVHLLSEGYSILEIDETALAFGMPMGPLRLLDEVGLDVAAHVSDTMLQAYGDRMKGPGYIDTLLKSGKKGKKSGLGFYEYNGEQASPSHDITSILDLPAKPMAVATREVLLDRLILSLVNEAVRCLDEGVAGKPGPEAANQIDLGVIMGMGFPPFRGGVLWYAEKIGLKTVYEKLSHLKQTVGPRYTPAEGIKRRVEKKLSLVG